MYNRYFPSHHKKYGGPDNETNQVAEYLREDGATTTSYMRVFGGLYSMENYTVMHRWL